MEKKWWVLISGIGVIGIVLSLWFGNYGKVHREIIKEGREDKPKILFFAETADYNMAESGRVDFGCVTASGRIK